MFEGIMQPMHLLVILVIAYCFSDRPNSAIWARVWETESGISKTR